MKPDPNRDPNINDFSYMLNVFREELFLQTMTGSTTFAWRNLRKPYQLTPDNDDACAFNLGPIIITTTNVSNRDNQHQTLTVDIEKVFMRRPDSLLSALLFWADGEYDTIPEGFKVLFGELNHQYRDVGNARNALQKFVKSIGKILNSYHSRPSWQDKESVKEALLWYKILQDWATDVPGGIVLSRLRSD
jgi:hypothetical protein